MINWATEEEVEKFSNFDFRLLTIRDFSQYTEAYRESVDSMANYLDLGYFSEQRSYLEMLKFYTEQLKDRTVDLFGIFDKGRLLGVANYYWTTYSENGAQITLWLRSSEKNKGLGTYFMKRLTSNAIFEKKFRFVELMIDEMNVSSRRMAENVGYELMEILEVPTQGKKGSGKYCRYILFDGEIESIAMNYHHQPIDLIDHPAYDKELRHLIHNEDINNYLKWPWPILNKRHFSGRPFGLELDKAMREALAEEERFEKSQLAKFRSPEALQNSRRIITFKKSWYPYRPSRPK